MTSIAELFALFPGYRGDKKIISIDAQEKFLKLVYEDGTTITMSDPVQVQDIKVPVGRGHEFMARVRSLEPTASKSMYFERELLESILKEMLDGCNNN